MDKPKEAFFTLQKSRFGKISFGPYPVVTAIEAGTPEAEAYYANLKELEIEAKEKQNG
jgi:hypothetical protein